MHLDSPDLTWTHLISRGFPDLIYLKGKGTPDLPGEKGRNLMSQREQGKGLETIFEIERNKLIQHNFKSNAKELIRVRKQDW